MGHIAGHIGQRCAIDVDACLPQLGGNDPVAQVHRPQAGLATHPSHLLQRRQPLAPVRRAHALHPPALLVDQDRRVTPHRRAQIRGQAAQLLGVFDIARKKG